LKSARTWDLDERKPTPTRGKVRKRKKKQEGESSAKKEMRGER